MQMFLLMEIKLDYMVCVQSIDDDFTNEKFYERKGPFFKADETKFSSARMSFNTEYGNLQILYISSFICNAIFK